MSRSRATRSKSFPTGITPLPLHDHGNFTIAFPPNRPTAIMASSTDSATTGILSSLTPIVFMRAVAVARWLNARHWSRSPFTGSCSPDAPCRENTSAAYRLQPHGRSAPPRPTALTTRSSLLSVTSTVSTLSSSPAHNSGSKAPACRIATAARGGVKPPRASSPSAISFSGLNQ